MKPGDEESPTGRTGGEDLAHPTAPGAIDADVSNGEEQPGRLSMPSSAGFPVEAAHEYSTQRGTPIPPPRLDLGDR